MEAATEHQESRDEVVIPIDGVFDPPAATALRSRVRSIVGDVVLDFSRTREIYVLGLAVIAYGFANEGMRVRYRGLTRHHERMLQYLGCEIAS